MRENYPPFYDGTQFVIRVILPVSRSTTGYLYEHVYGIRLNDGAKPWPYYRDAHSKTWWSLSTPGNDTEVDALVWMIDLAQLAYKSRDEAQAFLESVLPELAERAAGFGAAIEAQSDVPEALARMDRVTEFLKVRDYTVTILVAAPKNRPISVARWWWQALEAAGLSHGDGDLFWFLNEPYTDDRGDNGEPYELFCVEPFSVPGYFHVGDLYGPVKFPDVAFHFRAQAFASNPVGLLHRMAGIAGQVAQSLGAMRLAANGQPFRIDIADQELTLALAEIERRQTGLTG